MTDANRPQAASTATEAPQAGPEPSAGAPGPSAQGPVTIVNDETAPQLVMGAPLEVFVRGDRTRPLAHDMAIAAREADAEQRRGVAAAERKLAAKPIGAGGGAMMYTNKFTDTPDAQETYFDLKYVTKRGEPYYMQGQELGCLADLQALPDGSLQFIMVCPKCKENGLPQAECQMTINIRNKRFEIDPPGPGDIIMFDDGFGVRPYRSAGTIRESERFRCDRCSWACRIEKNRVRPE